MIRPTAVFDRARSEVALLDVAGSPVLSADHTGLQVRFNRTWASVLMDLVRGLAAVLVLIEHWRHLLFADYNELPIHHAWTAVAYLLSSAGHQSVIIFFVLSGFLISRSVFSMFQRGAWSWRVYLTHRLVRLWVVLLPGLLLCAFWDAIGIHANVAPALYGGVNYNHMVLPVMSMHSPRLFLSNLFFLQEIRTPTFGSDGALWSLSYEFWYYILFPLGFIAIRHGTLLRVRLQSIACFVAIATVLAGTPILSRSPIWLAGTLLAMLPAPRLPSWVRALATCIYVPLLLLIAVQRSLPTYVSDIVLAVITFLLLWIFLSAGSEAPRSPIVRFSWQLSRFSYTMYVVHTPFLVVITAFLLHNSRWFPTPTHVLIAICVLGLSVAYAYALAWITEFRTDSVRRWLEPIIARGANATG